jgi:hypothetical protein
MDNGRNTVCDDLSVRIRCPFDVNEGFEEEGCFAYNKIVGEDVRGEADAGDAVCRWQSDETSSGSRKGLGGC